MNTNTFDELIDALKKIINDNDIRTHYGYNDLQNPIFVCGENWSEDESVLIEISRFLVEGNLIKDEKLPIDEYGNVIFSEQIRSSDYITFDIEPLEIINGYNYLVVPYVKLSKISTDSILVDIFDIKEQYDDFGYYSPELSQIPSITFEIHYNADKIKNNVHYKLSLNIDEKTNEELSEEMKALIKNKDIDKYQARNYLCRQYGMEYVNKFTWIMYNLLN